MKFCISSSFFNENIIKPADESIIEALKKKGIETQLLNPANYSISLNSGKNKIYAFDSDSNQYKLASDSDVLLVKRTRKFERETYELAKAMEYLGVTCVDNANSLAVPTGKIIPHLYRDNNVNCPKSLFLPKIDGSHYDFVKQNGFDEPFIIKPQFGTLSEGFQIINNLEGFLQYSETYPNTPIIIQEKIDISKEYRVIVVGDKSLGACLKVTNSDGKETYEFQKNASDVENYSLKATKSLSGEILGVDIAISTNGQFYVFECNRNPNFTPFAEASGIPVADKIIDYCISKRKIEKNNK